MAEAERAPLVAATTLLGIAMLVAKLWPRCRDRLERLGSSSRKRHRYSKARLGDDDENDGLMAYPNRISLAAPDHRQLFLTHHPRGGQQLPKMLQLTQSEVGDMETGTRYRRDERMMAPTVDDYAEEIEDEEFWNEMQETYDQQREARPAPRVNDRPRKQQQQRNDHAHLTTRRVTGAEGEAFSDFLTLGEKAERAAREPSNVGLSEQQEKERMLRSALESVEGSMISDRCMPAAPVTAPALPGRSGLYAPRGPSVVEDDERFEEVEEEEEEEEEEENECEYALHQGPGGKPWVGRPRGSSQPQWAKPAKGRGGRGAKGPFGARRR